MTITIKKEHKITMNMKNTKITTNKNNNKRIMIKTNIKTQHNDSKERKTMVIRKNKKP
jgi:hypothetical protein